MTTGMGIQTKLVTIALSYRRRGWAPIPVPYRCKNPNREGWQKERLSEDEIRARFNGQPQNIGVLLGEPSGWLTDIDLDHLASVELADKYLPPTAAIFGRKSKPRSHFLYKATATINTQRFTSKVYGTLAEIRSTGLQTVFPPSVHPSGEQILWEPESGAPAEIEPQELVKAVEKLVKEVKAKLQVDKVDAAFTAMMKMAMADHTDGSARLYAAACRAVEHDLTDQQAVDCIRAYEQQEPFPREWSDKQILDRVRDAEKKTERGKARQPSRKRRYGLPEIDAGCQHLPTITMEAWAAVRKANDPPRLFRYGGRLMRSETGDEGEFVLKDVSLDRMRFEAAAAAFWFKWHKPSKAEEAAKIEVAPPDKVVRNMLATPDIDLPRLTRIVEAPVFAPDGTIQTQPGYHPASRTYFAPAKGLVVPEVPKRPTQDDIDHANGLLCYDLMSDFPFIGDSEKAHALALILQPFARDLIDGCTPLYLFEKPCPGTGATLLVSEVIYIATGRPLLAMTEGRDEDEWRKRLTAKLRTGASHVVIDNLKARLDAAALSAAITSSTWEDRILSTSETAKIPVRCCWVATGNNPAVSSEIARRTVRIRLDAKIDRPWQRSGFRHPDLHSWVRQSRGQLIWAALTLVQAWLAAGRPLGDKKLGGFEAWSQILGGILDVAGVPGFLANTEEFYEASDAEGTALRGFITAWWEKHGESEVTTKDLWPLIDTEGVTIDVGDGTERSQKTRFGKIVGTLRDRMFSIGTDSESEPEDELDRVNVLMGGGAFLVRVEAAGTRKRANLWKLRRMENESRVNV